ncbi:MAG: tetratricopeptide repeat protein [Planctomycetes bacterium]|nr:tetratricopeptide repeat protein [Planctomycetota bacterium]
MTTRVSPTARGGALFLLLAAASAQDPGAQDPIARILGDPTFQRQFAESYLAETEIEPRVTEDERDLLQEAITLLGTGKNDEAAALLAAQRNAASSAVVDFTFANIKFQGEAIDEAIPAYDAAVAKYPRFRRAWKNLGLCHVRKADFAPAGRAFARVIELGGGDALTWGLLGVTASNTENWLGAESAFRMAITLDPNTLDWQMGLARALFKQTRFADAAALCGQLLAQQPERGDLWLLQANAFLGQEKPRLAARNLEMVDRLGQATVASLSTLADIYVNDELYDQAARCYLQAMQLDPKGAATRGLRAAKVLAARRANAETKVVLERLAQVPTETLTAEMQKDVLKLRARLAVAEGAGDEEAKLLEEIVALDPLDGDAAILLGQHAQRQGNDEQAVLWYERAAGLPAFEADAKVRHAQLLVGKGKYVDALPLLRRAQTLKPRDSIQDYLEKVERAASRGRG